MKKLFVMLMALTVLSVPAFAERLTVTRPDSNAIKANVHKHMSKFMPADVAKVDSSADKTVAVIPSYFGEEVEKGTKLEAEKVFMVYFAANPEGEVQEDVYAPLADLLASAVGLKQLIARTHNEDYAIQNFFSSDIPGKYTAVEAINPELAAATNALMRSFIDTVSNGAFYGGDNHPDIIALKAFKAKIGCKAFRIQ